MCCIWIGAVEPWEKAHFKSPSKVLELLKNQNSEGVGTALLGSSPLHVWHGAELQHL